MAPGTQSVKNGRSKRPYGVSTVGTSQAPRVVRPLKKRRRGKRTRRMAARQANYELQVSLLCSLMSDLRLSGEPRQDFAERMARLNAAAWGQKARRQFIPRSAGGKREPMGVRPAASALAPSRIQLGKRGSGPAIPRPAERSKRHAEADPPQKAKRLRPAQNAPSDGRDTHGHRWDSNNGRHAYSHRWDRGNGRHRAGHRYDSNRRH